MRPLALAGIAAALGGVGWAAKALNDGLVRGHLAHTGYTSKDLSDRLAFIVPLLFLFALVVAYRRERRAGLAWAAAGAAVIAVATFWEAWLYGSGVPTGLLALPGFLMLAIGLIATRVLAWAAVGVLTLAQPLGSTILYSTLRFDGNVIATQWEMVLSVLVGAGWVLAGVRLLRRRYEVPALTE